MLSGMTKQLELGEAFEQEGINFAKAAEKFGKILGKEVVEPEMWKKCHQKFRQMAYYHYPSK